jgi:hypothetical protein
MIIALKYYFLVELFLESFTNDVPDLSVLFEATGFESFEEDGVVVNRSSFLLSFDFFASMIIVFICYSGKATTGM